MKASLTPARTATLALLITPWLFLASQREEKLVFTPRVGTKIAKQFDFELDLRVTSCEMDGVDRNDMVLSFEPMHLATSARFTDSYEKVDGSRPLEFVRRFLEVVGTWKYGGKHSEIDGFDALTDTAVRFTWQPAKQAYVRSMLSGRVPGLDLDQLVLDLDLCGFLPEAPVKPGANWTARGRPLMDALFGSTEMGLLVISASHPERSFTRDVFLRPLRDLGDKRLEIACLLSAGEDSLEPHTSKIDLRWDDKYAVDVTKVASDHLVLYPGSLLQVTSLQLEWKFDGRGRLAWDIAEGHFDSLELEAAIQLEIDYEAPSLLGYEGPFVSRFRVEGLGKWTLRAKLEP